MKTLHYIPLLIILFLSACTSDETPFPPEPDGQGNVTFLFKAGSELNTRTVLNSSENHQHVEEVHLYIFEGTGDAATYKETKEIPSWPKPSDVNYVTTTRSYSITLKPGDYTFLAIGLDDKSGATYNLPAAVTTGITLAEAKAVLASGQTRTDIAQSELYAGSATSNVKESGNAAVTIDLWRRVAGVMGWFKNIPTQINNTAVSKVQIAFYTQQNKSGYLMAKKLEMNDITNPANFKDYITDPISSSETDKIVASMDVPADIDATTVLSAGSYMLPAAAPKVGDGTEYTLRIELIGSNGNVLKTIRVKTAPDDPLYIDPTTGGGTGIIDIGGPFRFPIVANHFYSIGTAMEPVDLDPGTGGDGNIVITVNPNWIWKGDLTWGD